MATAPHLYNPFRSPQGLGALVALAALIALVVGALIWSRTPDYRVLYSNLSDRDGGAVVAALQQMNVPYKFADGGGAVLVPSSQVHEARMRLASQGLPKGGLVGFELMENQKLGTSQFLEQVNYQRALEGELARSIQSLSAVAAARVHLALSKPSLFVREQQKPTASVLVNLNPGRTLDPVQVSAIVHMVSSSVPDLPVKNVTLLDQNGNLLSSNGDSGGTSLLDPSQLKYVREIEQGYSSRIESILTPVVGSGNVRAQVTAEVDFTHTEQAAESYKPNQGPQVEATVRSQQSSESSAGAANTASGVAGALSNQPSAAAAGSPGTAAQSAPAQTPAAAPGRRESTVNYEVDKTVKYTRTATGLVKRLAVAVVVNQTKEIDPSGKVVFKPLAEAQIAQIRDLAREAIGLDKERGDTLNVVNTPFVTPEPEALPETPFWKNPAVLDTGMEIGKNVLIAAVVLYLVLGVLRPMLSSLAKAVPVPAPQELEAGRGDAARRGGYQENLDLARSLAREEPKMVANVVKQWVAGNE